MRTHSKPTLLVLLLGILFFSSSAFGQEENKETAKNHFEAGKNLMKVNEYDKASEHFEKSVDLFPTKAAMLNLANCYLALHDYNHALGWYQRLKFKYKSSLGEDLLEVVNEHIREIKSMSAKLKIDVKQNGAMVKVDGREMGVSPLTSYIIVAPGEHSVEVSLSGYRAYRKKIKATLGAQTYIDVNLQGPAMSKLPPPPAPLAWTIPVTGPSIEQKKKEKEKKEREEKEKEEKEKKKEKEKEKKKKEKEKEKKEKKKKEREEKEKEKEKREKRERRKRKYLPRTLSQFSSKTQKPKVDDEKKRLSPVPFIMTAGATLAVGIPWIGVDAKVKVIHDVEKENQTEALKERGERLQKVDGAMLGFTVGGVVASLVVFLFTDFKKGSKQKASNDSADVKLGSIAPVVIDGGGGVAMGGTF